MQNSIGMAAGELWQYLNTNGDRTIARAKKDLNMSAEAINRAIGWLAREEKLDFVRRGKSFLLRLK